MQKEFAKFAASPERVQNITLVSGSYGEHTIALIEGSAIKDLSGSNVGKKTIRAWWGSKKASETRRET